MVSPMNHLEDGKDKIKKICDVLRNETLDPAKQEAEKILAQAEEERMSILQEAEQKAADILELNQAKIRKERLAFESSLKQAFKQGIEALKESIDKQLFNQELVQWIEKHATGPQVTADLIKALIHAVEKEGISGELSACIPKEVPAEKVNALLTSNILRKLKEKEVVLEDFKGGAKIRLHAQRITLDMSEEAIFELIEKYIRKDFRQIIFAKSV